jgi:U32 family peptidase
MLVRETYPDIEIHLSVQANCVNWASASFWYKMGVKRLILSRELSIKEIAEIHQKVPDMELEAFVHGSICVAYSGRCLLSNYFNHRDANQGTCTNSCRWPYHVHERLPGAKDPDDKPIAKDNYKELSGEYYLEQLERPGELMPVDEDEFGTYIMNSKDLMALPYIEELRAAGIRSFKVEGRSKTIYYVSRTASIYRQAIDDLEGGINKNSHLLDDVMEVANRGYTTGFLKSNPLEYGQNYEESRPQSDKIRYAGQIRNFNSAKSEISVDVKNKICVGDVLTIISPGQKKENLKVKYLLNDKDEKVNCVSGGVNNVRINCNFPVNHYSLITNLVKQPIVTNDTGKELRNQ